MISQAYLYLLKMIFSWKKDTQTIDRKDTFYFARSLVQCLTEYRWSKKSNTYVYLFSTLPFYV